MPPRKNPTPIREVPIFISGTPILSLGTSSHDPLVTHLSLARHQLLVQNRPTLHLPAHIPVRIARSILAWVEDAGTGVGKAFELIGAGEGFGEKLLMYISLLSIGISHAVQFDVANSICSELAAHWRSFTPDDVVDIDYYFGAACAWLGWSTQNLLRDPVFTMVAHTLAYGVQQGLFGDVDGVEEVLGEEGECEVLGSVLGEVGVVRYVVRCLVAGPEVGRLPPLRRGRGVAKGVNGGPGRVLSASVRQSRTPVRLSGTPVQLPHTPIRHPCTPIHQGHTPVPHPQTPIQLPHTPIRHSSTPIHHSLTPIQVPQTPIHHPGTPIHQPHTPVHHSHTPVMQQHTPIHHPYTPTPHSIPISPPRAPHSERIISPSAFALDDEPITNRNTPISSHYTPTASVPIRSTGSVRAAHTSSVPASVRSVNSVRSASSTRSSCGSRWPFGKYPAPSPQEWTPPTSITAGGLLDLGLDGVVLEVRAGEEERGLEGVEEGDENEMNGEEAHESLDGGESLLSVEDFDLEAGMAEEELRAEEELMHMENFDLQADIHEEEEVEVEDGDEERYWSKDVGMENV